MELHNLEKPCDICGGVGNQELIVTCCHCKIAREHPYCFRVLRLEIPKVWFCEECISGKGIILGKKIKQKTVESGKVKFISFDEVKELKSGTEKMGYPSKGKWKYRSIIEKCVPQRVTSSLSVDHLAPINRPGPDGMQNNSSKHYQLSKTIKEQKAPINFAQKSGCKEQQVDFCQPDNEVKTCSVYVEERILLKHPICTPYHLFCPSLNATWKGGFKFFDATTTGKLYGGFQAQPPCKVKRKAYEFSKTMPEVIQVKLLPWCDVWEDVFQNDAPNFDDIALYFFPEPNVERSKEDHARLLELMETQDSAMRAFIGGVELVICTSKHLHVDSQDFIAQSTMEHFIWGVFRHTKDQTLPHKELPPLASPTEGDSYDHANMDCSDVIDMEVDMACGKFVGRVDVVVSEGDICVQGLRGNRNDCLQSQPGEFKIETHKYEHDQLDFSHKSCTKSPSEINTLLHWRPPPTDWVKLNVAIVGCSNGSPGVAVAAVASGIIRNASGKWVLGYVCDLGSQEIVAAELWALFQGLLLAWDRGFRKVLVESESQVAIDHLKRDPAALDPNKALIDCCKNMIEREWSCKVSHISEEANLSAKRLATHFKDRPKRLTIFDRPPPDFAERL